MAKATKKKVKRRPWSKEDVRELKKLAGQKIRAARIVKRLKVKRTVPALRQKAMALGISLDSRARTKRKLGR
jgi:hypothetical protein